MVFIIVPFFGEGNISYLYVRTRYDWQVKEYSQFNSITSTAGIVGEYQLRSKNRTIFEWSKFEMSFQIWTIYSGLKVSESKSKTGLFHQNDQTIVTLNLNFIDIKVHHN